MPRVLAAVLLAAFATGCGDSKPPAVPTDPDSIKRLEELQRKASRGEK